MANYKDKKLMKLRKERIEERFNRYSNLTVGDLENRLRILSGIEARQMRCSETKMDLVFECLQYEFYLKPQTIKQIIQQPNP